MSPAHTDVAVVGAGAAGLLSARTLGGRGRRVDVFEGRGRVGGRIWPVVHERWPMPLELGAEFIHGAEGPTLSTLASLGVAVDRVRDEHARYTAHSFRSMGDTWRRFAKLFAGADPDAEASAEDFLRRSALAESDAELFRLIVEGFDAAPLAEVSLRSVVAEATAAARDAVQFRPKGGYGRLIEGLTVSLPPEHVRIHLSSPVEAIEWRPGGPCTLTVRQDEGRTTVHADRCIVAVPVGVLQATEGPSRIRFDPELSSNDFPIAQLAMGHVVKIVLTFEHCQFAKSLPAADFLHFPGAPFPTMWREALGAHEQFTAWAGGPHAKRAENYGARDLVDLAAEQLASACDAPASDVRAALVAAHHHDFSRDPFSLGAYPFARPGGLPSVDVLSRPIGDCLFFAGDGTDPDHFATVHAALASGERAAEAVLRL
ncbi:MAG TPA: NAD(P)/FAD-dependent oxidoreductase [Polyangiaceae bacterium]|nr:NAD(P)/FAD-dependent oxidoreductase [Polyangiaceae bacterium]